jgi:hypothetical protein
LNLVVLLLCGFSIIVFSSWRGSERFHPRTHDARVMAQYQTPDEVAANAIIILPCKTLFEGAMHRNDPFLRETRPIFVMADETGAVSDLEAAFPNREIVYAAALETECRD